MPKPLAWNRARTPGETTSGRSSNPLSKLRAHVAQAEVTAALHYVDDFIARCNGNDRGSCESVNILRRALFAPVSGEAFMYGITGADGKVHFEEFCVSGSRGELQTEVVDHLNRDYSEDDPYSVVALFRDAAPQASEAVRNADVAALLTFIFERFGQPRDAGELPDSVVAAVRRLEVVQADKDHLRPELAPQNDGSDDDQQQPDDPTSLCLPTLPQDDGPKGHTRQENQPDNHQVNNMGSVHKHAASPKEKPILPAVSQSAFPAALAAEPAEEPATSLRSPAASTRQLGGLVRAKTGDADGGAHG